MTDVAPLPYNRALHPDDYSHAALAPHVTALRAFEAQLQQLGAPYRKDHQHREWEYGNVIRQLVEQGVMPLRGEITSGGVGVIDTAAPAPRILDTGSGYSYLVPYLKKLGYDITTSDSMAYGDCTEMLRRQCWALGVEIPLVVAPVEKLGLDDNYFDVTLCISVIEHLHTTEFEAGLRELVRVTKPGGYVMITSDFFRDQAHALTSPALGCQHNLFFEHNALSKIIDVIGTRVDVIGEEDPYIFDGPVENDPAWREMQYRGICYRGDFVNNYSFVNFCFRKR